jgi:hypothetical protein
MADLNTRAAEALAALHAQGRIATPWLEGMHAIWDSALGRDVHTVFRGGAPMWLLSPAARPDLSDPLTVQGLLVLLREVVGEWNVAVEPPNPGNCAHGNCVWEVGYGDDADAFAHTARGKTEADALVTALEAVAQQVPG